MKWTGHLYHPQTLLDYTILKDSLILWHNILKTTFLQPLNKEWKCANGAWDCSIRISNLIWDHMLLLSQDLSISRTHPTLAKPIILTNCIHSMVGNVWTKKIRAVGSKLQGSIGFKTLRIFEACFNILFHHLTQCHETN